MVFVASAAIAMAPRCDVHFAADDRLDRLRLGGEVKLEGTVEDAVIGQRDRRHIELFCRRDEVVDAARAVEQRIFTVNVEMDEAARHETPNRTCVCTVFRVASRLPCGLTCGRA